MKDLLNIAKLSLLISVIFETIAFLFMCFLTSEGIITRVIEIVHYPGYKLFEFFSTKIFTPTGYNVLGYIMISQLVFLFVTSFVLLAGLQRIKKK